MAIRNSLRIYSSTVTSKFQLTLPAQLARFYGWAPGTKVIFDVPDPESGEFVARRLDLVKAKHELARAVAQFQEQLAAGDISDDDLIEQAHRLIVAIRRFEDELLAMSSALVQGRPKEEARP